MSDARAAILARVRVGARRRAPRDPAPRAYRRTGALDRGERVELFCERTGEYRAEVRRVAADVGAARSTRSAARAGSRRLVVPAGLPAAWRPTGVELVDDTRLTPAELDAVDGVAHRLHGRDRRDGHDRRSPPARARAAAR